MTKLDDFSCTVHICIFKCLESLITYFTTFLDFNGHRISIYMAVGDVNGDSRNKLKCCQKPSRGGRAAGWSRQLFTSRCTDCSSNLVVCCPHT